MQRRSEKYVPPRIAQIVMDVCAQERRGRVGGPGLVAMAAELGMPPSSKGTISHWESGKHAPDNLDEVVEAYARALGTTRTDLWAKAWRQFERES